MDERELLARLATGRHSGDALARACGLTRAAVWKRVQNLRAAGVEIEGRAGDGYALTQPLELLDAAAIRAQMREPLAAALAGLEIVWSVESTNSALLRRPAPAQGVLALLAERQTGGRGRRGRSWSSPLAAHIYLSLSRSFAGGLARLAGLSLVAGVAACEALRTQGLDGIGLKWPNDLFAGNAKLGGLLVEGGGEVAGPARAVIGLGVNVQMPAAAAAAIEQPWTDLQTVAGQPLSRNRIIAALLSTLLPALEQFEAEGLAPFLPRYAALDLLIGRNIVIDVAGTLHEGIARGLAEDGALRVELAQGLRQFHAGEVSVRAR